METTYNRCQNCSHRQFGDFGKLGQEHYCDIDNHDITSNVIYGVCYNCPLDNELDKG